MSFKQALKIYVFIIGVLGIAAGIAQLLVIVALSPLGFLLMVATVSLPLSVYVLVPALLWWLEEK